jgi:hypothetical protein
MSNKSETVEKERVLNLATKIETLLQFTALLVEDLDLLERASDQSDEISSRILSAAPLIEALGDSYEEKHLEAEVRRKRAEALTKLVRVVKDTEDDRAKFAKDKKARDENRAKLNGFFGGI